MKTRAFTLIELLVVIAIIAILAAILFPVFAQAKVAAKKTQSLSNVKQIATGLMIYTADYDDRNVMSEFADNDFQVTWVAASHPYMKSSKTFTNPNTGVVQAAGTDGIFRSPSFPVSPVNNPTTWEQAQTGGFSYGVHLTIFAGNYNSRQQWFVDEGQSRPSMSNTELDNPADKVMMMEKGANLTWSYPWFHPWQAMWVGSIANTAGDESTVYRDGVDVYNPNSPMYDPRFDSDCNSTTNGNWECAAHARYRFNESAPMAFMDGHAATVKKGGIQWYKNIWVRRSEGQAGHATYWYLAGANPY